MIDEFIKCPKCQTTVQLTRNEQEHEKFSCPLCKETITKQQLTIGSKVNSAFGNSTLFEVTYKSTVIKVVVDIGNDVVVLVNNEIVLSVPYKTGIGSEIQELNFNVSENGRLSKYRVNIYTSHGASFKLECEVRRNGKLLLIQESNSSRVITIIIGIIFLLSLFFYLIF